MTATLAPVPSQYFPNTNNTGAPAAGFKLFTYVAGSSTKQNTWTDSTQSVINANPLPLDANGFAAASSASSLWLDPTLVYKFVWAPANDTDPPSSPIRSIDNIRGPLDLATLTQAVIGSVLYPRTAAEIGAGVTPVNYWYPPGNVKRYGATGNGVTDDTTAIQNAIAANDKFTVYFPEGAYIVSSTLTFRNQTITGENRENTIVKVSGNRAAFQNDNAQFIGSGSIENLSIWLNSGNKPPDDGSHNAMFAIYLRGPDGTSFLRLKNLEIRGALWAVNDDSSGSYGATLENVFAWNCKYGFRKVGGTTFSYIKCITLNTDQHFFMQDTLACSLTSCAGDGATITAANAGIDFRDCQGFVIDGWDSESNAWSGNNSALFSFLNSTGSVNGVVGYLNTQAATSPDFNSFIHIDGGQIHISGLKMQFAAGSLVFTGTGTPYGILAENGALVFISGSDINPATGGTPAGRVGLGATGTSRIYYSGTTTSGTASNAYNLFIESGSCTLTETGCTTSPTGTARWARAGSIVTLFFPDITGTSNTTACTLTGLDAAVYPARTQTIGGVRVQDNSVRAFGLAQIGTGGTITLFPSAAAGAWTAANTKGIESCTVTYSLD